MADEDVLGDAEVREDHRLLVDGDDTTALGVGGRAQLDGLTIDADHALVGLIDPGHRLDQRRLARPVLADEGMYLAGEQLDAGSVEGARRAEALVHIFERHQC